MPPCPNCGKHRGIAQTATVVVLPHPRLERIVQLLDQAFISEVQPDRRQVWMRLKAIIQSLQNPYIVPLETELSNLKYSAGMVGDAFDCWKCRKLYHWHVCMNVEWHRRLAAGDRGGAILLFFEKTAKEVYWLLRAAPVLFHKHTELSAAGNQQPQLEPDEAQAPGLPDEQSPSESSGPR
jgi:hypothetical protein